MKKLTKTKNTQRNLLKKMKRASSIYASNSLLIVEDKPDKPQGKLLAKPGMTSIASTGKLFNYSIDMEKQKNAQKFIKSLNLHNNDIEMEEEGGKADQTKIYRKNSYLSFLIIVFMLLVSSCARNTSFVTSPVVPAAQGTVKVKTDNNKNYVIQVKISDLADVSRLQPPKQSYVVWMETEQGRTEKLGQLLSSKSFLSKQMTADLQTVSSYKPVKIFVTAENDSNVQYPDRLVVLTTENF